MDKLPNNYQDLYIDADFDACEAEKKAGIKFTDEEYFEFIKEHIKKAVSNKL
jgi:hypothetical protein